MPTLDEHRSLALACGWEGAFDWDRMQGSPEALMDHVRRVASDYAFVGLFATDEGETLYRSRGFDVPGMTGLAMIVSPAG